MLEYHAAYVPMENGWYFATILDFPGAITQGKNLQHARKMARDALRTMVEWYMEDGQPLPRPNPTKKDKKATFTETIKVGARTLAEATP